VQSFNLNKFPKTQHIGVDCEYNFYSPFKLHPKNPIDQNLVLTKQGKNATSTDGMILKKDENAVSIKYIRGSELSQKKHYFSLNFVHSYTCY